MGLEPRRWRLWCGRQLQYRPHAAALDSYGHLLASQSEEAASTLSCSRGYPLGLPAAAVPGQAETERVPELGAVPNTQRR